MWKLMRESGGGQTYHFLAGTDYVVGRKNCTILIEDDQSISRAHASLSVSHIVSNLGQPDLIPLLTVKDTSKYGTFVSGERMGNGLSKNLKSGDQITFGVYNSKFRVMYEPLVACSSCLTGPDKSSLGQALLLLGGHAVNNWTETCTHLVMTSVKVTIKTICALICGKPIVKPEYFSEVIKAIQQKQTWPTLSSFLPIIDEPSLQSDSLDLSENVKRKVIFKDKTFLFLNNKQYKKLSPAIHFGGGKSKLLTRELEDQSILEDPRTCVLSVGMTESQLSEYQGIPTWITSTMNLLHSKGWRAIPEAEIGLAVIYMSTEIYCNPRQCAPNSNEAVSTGNSIEVSTLSSSLAVDETVLPATTFNTTAYVANTEPQDQTDNWVNISGVREVKETPKSNLKSAKFSVELDRDLQAHSAGDCRTALFQEQSASLKKKSHQVSSVEGTASAKKKLSQETTLTNKIQNYFQPVAKKRDRDEDKSEISTAKLPRVENLSSKAIENVVPPKQNEGSDLSIDMDSDLDEELVDVSNEKPETVNNRPNGGTEASAVTHLSDASVKKRKEPEEVVEESDLEEDDGFKLDQNNLKNQMKRRRMKSEDDLKDINTESLGKENTTKMIVQFKEENGDGLPSKLLLSEFRSLVVCHPARSRPLTANGSHGNKSNFKKFRKIAYPGAGCLPNIIGGSDLIAHDRKKNSELEQWLRQEMEQQTQQAREQSIAEDLFRYNPKMVKRRR